MDSKAKIFLGLIVFASITWYAINKFGNNDEIKKAIVRHEVTKVAQPEKSKSEAAPSPVSEVAKPELSLDSAQKAEKFKQRFLEMGYVQNPDNPNQLMKKTIGENGKSKIEYVDLNSGGFEPTDRTIKNALETLETKRGISPADEMASLRPLDEKIQDNIMLMGNFRDEVNDLELYFSPVSDENGNPLGYDSVCFVSPVLKMNFPKEFNKVTVRADETGYAVIKFSNTIYAKLTWSYEKNRTLHGEIWKLQSGAFNMTNTFAAVEFHSSKDKILKYCK